MVVVGKWRGKGLRGVELVGVSNFFLQTKPGDFQGSVFPFRVS